jgi:uncharacterized membrane protein
VLSRLLHGSPGHPVHPPLTDATIGMFVLAAALALLGALGVDEAALGRGSWLALVGGLVAAVPTALTGFADWLQLAWGTPRWRVATAHMAAMLGAVVLFGVAAFVQWDGYDRGEVTTLGLVLAIAGALVLTAGGWLGGSLVFVHGVRVLDGADEQEPLEAPSGESTRSLVSEGEQR